MLFIFMKQTDVALNLYDFNVRRPNKLTEKYGLRAYDEIILAPMVSTRALLWTAGIITITNYRVFSSLGSSSSTEKEQTSTLYL